MSEGGNLAFRVRAAEAADLPGVSATAAACEEAPPWPKTAWGVFVAGGPDAVLLLGLDGAERICGWIAGRTVAGSAELEFVLVGRAHRGRGLGRRLLEAWLRWAEERGAVEVFLEVRASNAAAMRLYCGFGFQEQGRRRGYYRAPVEDAVVMRLEVPGG